MKYETPELTALTPAINAIQTTKTVLGSFDSLHEPEEVGAYQDWE